MKTRTTGSRGSGQRPGGASTRASVRSPWSGAVVLAIALLGLVFSVSPAMAQAPRQDAIWARMSSAPITLNGQLTEPAWATAESMIVVWAQDSGIPGSGWKVEGGAVSTPSDPMRATLKFLMVGNQLYLGAVVRDASVGGSADFNKFDGLIMALKDHLSPDAPKPPAEHTYLWWYPTHPDPQPPGQSPSFVGKWATWPPGSARTPTQIANWDAVTVVNGQSNNDAIPDTKYTIEMRFNVAALGYDVTRPEGDIIEWNVSVYDADWLWPLDAARWSSNRTWWQGPWGNSAFYNEVRIHARPNVTTSSGPVPAITPEMVVFNGANFPLPAINGQINEPVWAAINPIRIHYGDDQAREMYPEVGRYRAGQYQPPVNGGQAAVIDPGDADVRVFFRDNFLYLGFDVRDQVVQYHPSFDRWDGFLVTINDRTARSDDHNLIGRRLSFQVGPTGGVIAADYLLTLIQSGGAQVAIALKAGTTVDTLGQTPDVGYTAELAIDLLQLGYPAGLGDRSLFLGVNLLDGDSFTPYTNSYGTRTWWYREYEGTCCPVWAYMDPGFVTGVEGGEAGEPVDRLVSYPNPGVRPTIEYSLPEEGVVFLDIFDVQGRLVESLPLGLRPAGAHQTVFDGKERTAGIYPYRLRVNDPSTGATRSTLFGKMVLVR